MTSEVQAGASLRLHEVAKSYGTAVAVDRATMNIEAGEFITFLGPSGSGKTTTLNMIAGFVDASAGEIEMDGRSIQTLPPHKRDIGMVFQHYALFPHMTVSENVGFPLKQRKIKGAEFRDRIRQALNMVRLEEFGDRYPRQLSGGQQQRVALARAIVFEPRLLLMDEPLGALDKRLREWLQLEFKRIHRELGITFIYVTHDQEEALVLSDRIAIFRNGRIDQIGTAVELYERPQTLFVAEFLGDSTTFHGRVAENGDQVQSEHYDLQVANTHGLADGTPAVVVVRPERLRLVNGDTSGNVVDAVVRQTIYLGASRRIEVDLPCGRRGTLREVAHTGRNLVLGDKVQVQWAADEAAVVPNDESAISDIYVAADA